MWFLLGLWLGVSAGFLFGAYFGLNRRVRR